MPEPAPAATLCILDGRLLPLAEARIDPLDRGFLFGDALYEAVKVSNGVILHLEPHLERLRAGLREIRIPIPGGLAEQCRELVAASGFATGYLYLQVTRGAAPRSHRPPLDLEPTVFLMPVPHTYAPPGSRRLSAITVPDLRWRRCSLKTTSLLATVLGKLEAGDRKVDEVLFTGEDGDLREAGSANLFVRQEGRLLTHPLDGRILAGVTRALLLRLADRDALPVVEEPPRLGERGRWQEALLCGTLTDVQPLVELDGEPIAGGEPGPWTARLAAAFAAYEQGLLAAAQDGAAQGPR